MNKTGKFLGIILMLLLGILLLSFAFQPPKVFTFSNGYSDRIVCRWISFTRRCYEYLS